MSLFAVISRNILVFCCLVRGQSSLCLHLDGVAGRSDMLRQEDGAGCPTTERMGQPETTPGVAKTKGQTTDETKDGHGPATHVTSDDEDLCPAADIITVQPQSGIYTVQPQSGIYTVQPQSGIYTVQSGIYTVQPHSGIYTVQSGIYTVQPQSGTYTVQPHSGIYTVQPQSGIYTVQPQSGIYTVWYLHGPASA